MAALRPVSAFLDRVIPQDLELYSILGKISVSKVKFSQSECLEGGDFENVRFPTLFWLSPFHADSLCIYL